MGIGIIHWHQQERREKLVHSLLKLEHVDLGRGMQFNIDLPHQLAIQSRPPFFSHLYTCVDLILV